MEAWRDCEERLCTGVRDAVLPALLLEHLNIQGRVPILNARSPMIRLLYRECVVFAIKKQNTPECPYRD